ncbi:amidohydrolase family protein [Hyphococcus lacteus]|uniref:Amidohydrolase family protein n=1 Tax=Hyphococcus lacteus TaxID=3143536 RepID=A0ABV3Z880_9PROT
MAEYKIMNVFDRTISLVKWLAFFACFATTGAAAPWDDAPISSTYRPIPSDPIIIRNATILDGAGARFEGRDILIRDGHVIAIGNDFPTDGVDEIDASGLWVTPGIIDIHSHNGTNVRPRTDSNRQASDVSEGSDVDVGDTWIETAIDPQDTAFARALSRGVTTIQVLPGSAPIFGGHSVIVKPVPASTVSEMKFPNAPLGFKMACGENPKWKGADASSTKDWPTSRAGVHAYMRDRFDAAREMLVNWQATGSVSDDAKTVALAGVLAGKINVHFHCYRAFDMSVMLNLAREYGFQIKAFHHATEAYKIVDQLRAAGTCSAVWSDWWGYKREAMDAIRANAPLLHERGGCVMMHSDSPFVGQYLNIEAAKAEAAGRRLGLSVPEEQMVRWITSAPASAIGLGDRIGTIAPGFAADIVLWNGNPFSAYSRPKLVLIDGAIRFNADAEQRQSDFDLGRTPAIEVMP